MVYPTLLPLMRTPQLPVVDWTDAPRQFKRTYPFHQQMKSGFCACAVTFRTQSTMPSETKDFTKQAFNMALFIINNAGPVHVRSMGQVFVLFWFSPVSIIPPILHTHSIIHMVPTIILATNSITNPSMPTSVHHRLWMHWRVVDYSWNVMAHSDEQAGKWRGNWRMECVSSTLHPTSEHGVVSSITTIDAHTSAAFSWLNWCPHRFKWTRPFCQNTKSGFCVCAITYQLASTSLTRQELYIQHNTDVC